MNKLTVPIVVSVVVFGGAGFFGGMLYQKSQAPSGSARFGNGNFNGLTGDYAAGRRTGQNANLQGGPVNGDITAKDDQSITVKLRDGSSKIIFYSGSTQISKMGSGSIDDLAVGQGVMVSGTPNSDGSIAAQSIQLRPTGQQSIPGDNQKGNNPPPSEVR